METTPVGVRLPQDEAKFRSQTPDPLIEPDRVSPAIEGYFRLPAVWIGDPPTPTSVDVLNPAIHHEKVFKTALKCGIFVQVQRDGLFLFDFSSWQLAPIVVIPGFRKPNLNGPYRPLPAHSAAQEKAENFAVIRAQVMNVHQACLTTAERQVQNRSAAMGFPVTAWNTHKAINFDSPPAYFDDIENLHALGQNVLNNKDRIKRNHSLQRRSLEIKVVETSMYMLDNILVHEDKKLFYLVESTYIAACRNSEKRFGEALTLAWGVCEQLIFSEWHKHLSIRAEKRTAPLSKERRKKLLGRDYTASVMVEMLELGGRIDEILYRQLEIARKARNNWIHEMQSPKESEVYVCLQAAQSMLLATKGINLKLQAGGRGGVPEWPYWMWEKIKQREATIEEYDDQK